MGRIKKIGEQYYVEFEARGLKYQQLAGHTEAQAQRLLNEIEDKIQKGEASLFVRDVDTAVFFYDFLEYVQTSTTLQTLHRFKSLLADFIAFLNSTYPHVLKLSDITPKVIESYKVKLTQAHSSRVVNLSLILLQDVFFYAVKCQYLNDNPTLHIKLLNTSQQKMPAYLTPADYRELMDNPSLAFALWADRVLKAEISVKVNRAVLKNTLARELIFSRVPFYKISEILQYVDICRCIRYVPFLQEFKRSVDALNN